MRDPNVLIGVLMMIAALLALAGDLVYRFGILSRPGSMEQPQRQPVRAHREVLDFPGGR